MSTCSIHFRNTDSLKSHLKTYHKVKLSEGNEFICKVDKCNKSFKFLKSFINHINDGHELYPISQNQPYSTHSTNPETNRAPAWTPKNMNFNSKMAHMVADLRFSTTITGADIGRCVATFENLLSETMNDVIMLQFI